MNDTSRYVLYGKPSPTPVFLYTACGFFLVNAPFSHCLSAVSFGAFVLCSLLLLPLFLFLVPRILPKLKSVSLRHSSLGFIAVLLFLTGTGALCFFESLSFLLRLYENVGNPPSRSFCVVLCTVLFAVSIFAALRGVGTLFGIADVGVLLPVVTLVLCFFGFFEGGMTWDIFGKAEGTPVCEILRGVFSSLLVFADSFTVLFLTFRKDRKMRHDAERNAGKAVTTVFSAGYLASLLLFCLSFLLLRSLFGVAASSRLAVPFASASSMIPGFDAEELFVFFYSFCILYRSSVRLCFASECFSFLGLCGKRSRIATTVFGLLLLLLVSVCFMREEVLVPFSALSPAVLPALSGIAFVLLPLLLGLSEKE